MKKPSVSEWYHHHNIGDLLKGEVKDENRYYGEKAN
jgi:hypothetical protein